MADDAAWIVELHAVPHARAFLSQPTAEQVRASIAQSERAERIVECAGERVGLWSASLDEDWIAELRTIAALRPAIGVGTFALRRALAWAFDEKGVHRVHLDVTAANLRARRLYERAGFRLEGVWRDGFRRRDGSYEDLCGYGILAGEYAKAAQAGTREPL